jgi:glycosidase
MLNQSNLKGLAIGTLMAMSALGANAATFVGDRTDFRDETIYFAMTTRFYDGDPSNNTQCWDAQNYNVGDPAWRGDFKGLIQKLDYIKALGFTAVWITPVVQNASGYDYHGYHASDFSKVDIRYESTDCKFQDLIDAAHARGMKIILDIVLNHTGNFGEEHLCKLFTRDANANQAKIDECMVPYTKKDGGQLSDNYLDMASGLQYSDRLSKMKNTDGVNHDTHNYWHHFGSFNWDDDTRWWAQIAGDCVDLNTENQYVADYLVKCYGEFIKMGVDGFRIDTSGHISRLTFNKNFIPQFTALAEQYKDKRGGGDFFMFGEVCSRDRNYTYRGQDRLSPYFYTWKETKDYAWDTSTTSWDNIVVMEGAKGSHTNVTSVDQQAKDYVGEHSDSRTSTNAFLNGNAYHTPDRSQYSGFSVIDFPMHWNFRSASEAWGIRSGDKYYNDASYNVVYVDSHDYAPDGAPESQRFAQSQDTWAENLSLMFTFRGIPCLYYGSEIEFKKGCVIDNGPNCPLNETGRAYFGGYIKGNVTVSDFAQYSNASGNIAATLSHPLSLHVQRLNQLRAAIPALRKGQYSTDGCSGSFAFKRRYTDDKVDSYVLVTISGSATFSNIENGTYVDAITGDTKTVTNGTLTASCSGKGNLRLYVLNTSKTKAPGKVGVDGKYLYNTSAAADHQSGYDGTEEETTTEYSYDDGTSTGGGGITEPENPVEPSMDKGEQAVFFENTSNWSGTIRAYVWSNSGSTKYAGEWPGSSATYLGNQIWKWSYSGSDKIGDNAGLIFNNGSTQTSDFTWVNGGYYNANGYVKTIEGAGEIPDNNDNNNQNPVTETQWHFYYNDTNFGSNVYAYFWDAGNGNKKYLGEWPGTQMEVDNSGVAKYHITFTTTDDIKTPMIIFNNGNGGNGNQTADLTAVNYGIYNQNGLSATGITSTLYDSALSVRTAGRQIIVSAPHKAVISIVGVDGTSRLVTLHAGVNRFDVAPGFYIVNRVKVMIH